MNMINDSVRARLDSELPGRRDASGPGAAVTGSIFLERQLNHIMPSVLEAKLPQLNAFRVFPMDTSVPWYVSTHSRQMLTSHGVAEWIADYSDDLPQVGVSGEEQVFRLADFGVSYGWSLKEIAAAMASNVNLRNAKAIAARRAAEEKHNRTIFFGDSSKGLYGATNYPHFPRTFIANPIATGTAADTVLADMHDFVLGIHTRTNQVARPTRLLMPTAAYDYVSRTFRSANSDKTILQAFLDTSQFITEVIPVAELDGAGPNGEDIMMAFEPSERLIASIVPAIFNQRPVQERNLSFVVPCHATNGGVASDYPLEVGIGVIPDAA